MSLFPEDREWIGARYKYPGQFREAGENFQPDIVFWMEMPSGMIVSTTLIHPRKPVSFADSFVEAIQPRENLSLPRPTSFAELAEMTGGMAQPTYLDCGDVTEDVLAEFFDAAYSLFKTAPWRVVAEQQVIGVDIPRLKIKVACLSVIGGNEESLGLLLFRSLEDYLAFGRRPAKGGRTKDRVAMRSMSFGSRKDLPPSMLREIKTHRWPVAGAKSYPTLFCVDRSMQPVPVTDRDYRIMTACASAFLLFFEQHRDIFDADRAAVVKASFVDESGLTVFFTAPY